MRSACALCLVVLALVAFDAAAAEWSVRYSIWQTEDFVLPHATPRGTERRGWRLAWHTDHGDSRSGIVYAYQSILIRTGAPATNGYLHRLDFTHSGGVGALRYHVTLGLHGSSNIFSYGEWRSEVLVGTFVLRYPLSGVVDSVGVAGDYRFGEFLVYPRVSAVFPINDTRLVVDFPVKLAWRDPGGQWRVMLERYGAHWATLDTSETVEGELYFSEWQIKGQWRLWRSGGYRLSVGLGWSFDSEARYLDLRRGVVEGELEPAFFGFVVLGHR